MAKSVYVSSADKMPKCEHWAIIRSSSVSIPGDERSRTAPGHGYPEHTDHYITYEAFETEVDFKKEMESELRSPYTYSKPIGIHVHGAYTSKISFELTSPK